MIWPEGFIHCLLTVVPPGALFIGRGTGISLQILVRSFPFETSVCNAFEILLAAISLAGLLSGRGR